MQRDNGIVLCPPVVSECRQHGYLNNEEVLLPTAMAALYAVII